MAPPGAKKASAASSAASRPGAAPASASSAASKPSVPASSKSSASTASRPLKAKGSARSAQAAAAEAAASAAAAAPASSSDDASSGSDDDSTSESDSEGSQTDADAPRGPGAARHLTPADLKRRVGWLLGLREAELERAWPPPGAVDDPMPAVKAFLDDAAAPTTTSGDDLRQRTLSLAGQSQAMLASSTTHEASEATAPVRRATLFAYRGGSVRDGDESRITISTELPAQLPTGKLVYFLSETQAAVPLAPGQSAALGSATLSTGSMAMAVAANLAGGHGAATSHAATFSHQGIQYGVISGPALSSLYHFMQNVFMPRFVADKSWVPETVYKDFKGTLYKFMAFLTDQAHRRDHATTVLYVPSEDLGPPAQAAASKDVVTRLESLVMQWTRQIKEDMKHDGEKQNADMGGPTSYARFWQERAANLASILGQLRRADVEPLIEVLRLANSTQYDQLIRFRDTLVEEAAQAKENLTMLSLLVAPCQQIAEAAVTDIQKLLPHLLRCVRVISVHSSYYSSRDKLTQLLRKISIEIIQRCSQEIDLDTILFAGSLDNNSSTAVTASRSPLRGSLDDVAQNGDVSGSSVALASAGGSSSSGANAPMGPGDIFKVIQSLQDAIACCESWKAAYHDACLQVERYEGRVWDFDRSSIFAQLDAFIQRCRDLLEVCDGQIQFAGLRPERTRVAIPQFSGTRGPAVAKRLQDLERTFRRHVAGLARLHAIVLNVKATQWHDEFNVFKQAMKSLDVTMQNIMALAMEDVATAEDHLGLLLVFQDLCHRDVIARSLSKRTADFLQLVNSEFELIKSEFEQNRKAPEILRTQPDHAGTAFWAHGLGNRLADLSRLMEIANNQRILPVDDSGLAVTTQGAPAVNPILSEFQARCEVLQESLTDVFNKTHAEWASSITSNLFDLLKTPLMGRSRGSPFLIATATPGQFDKIERLVICFNSDILRTLQEVHYFVKLKADIPFAANELYTQREELRILRENVASIVRQYNAMIASLHPGELSLFRERLKFLNKKLNPGLTTLTWASRGITDYFVKESYRHLQESQKVVRQFQDYTAAIDQHCQRMTDTRLWHNDAKNLYDLGEFEEAHAEQLGAAGERLSGHLLAIANLLADIHALFRKDAREVAPAWDRFVSLMESRVGEALRISARRCLNDFGKTLFGQDIKARGSGSGSGGAAANSSRGKLHGDHGDDHNDGGLVDVAPLLKVNVVLDKQRVSLFPAMATVETTIQKAARDMVSLIAELPSLRSIIVRQLSQASHGAADSDALPTVMLTSPHGDTSSLVNLIQEDDVAKQIVSIHNGLTASDSKFSAYLHHWDTYREIWELNKDAFIRRYAKLKPALSTFDADINRYNEVANNVQKEETMTGINFIRLDCSPLKAEIVNHCDQWRNKLTHLLNSDAQNSLNGLYEYMESEVARLSDLPQNLDALADRLDLLASVQAEIPALLAKFGPIREQYDILAKYEVQITPDELLRLAEFPAARAQFEATTESTEVLLNECKTRFKAELLLSSEDAQRQIQLLKERFQSGAPTSVQTVLAIQQRDVQQNAADSPSGSSINMAGSVANVAAAAAKESAGSAGSTSSNVPPVASKALAILKDFQSQYDEAIQRERYLLKGMSVFGQIYQPSMVLENLAAQIAQLKGCWQLFDQWEAVWRELVDCSFLKIDSAQLEKTIVQYQKKIAAMQNDAATSTTDGASVRDYDVLPTLQERLAYVRKLVPLVGYITNPALRSRHWEQIKHEIGHEFDHNDKSFTIEAIHRLGMDTHIPFIADLCSAASMELAIETSLSEIEAAWEVQVLEFAPYKEALGLWKFKGLDAIFELLDEHQVVLSTMKSNRFHIAFKTQVSYWESSLTLISENIDLALTVQRQWNYLENIFVGSQDIRKQLPQETHLFDQLNDDWVELLKSAREQPKTLTVMINPALAPKLQGMNERLERIEKSLDDYLETKRQAFPRFYFLSNDDLLEILGQGKDPNAVQPHLKKCFDNLHRLELTLQGPEHRKHYHAIGMYAGDGEYVPFAGPVVVEGPVEMWLTDIESMMRRTLQNQLGQTLQAYTHAKRDRWLRDWPGQCLITASLINWTSDCTKAFREAERNNNDVSVIRHLKKKQISSLKKWSELVRLPLSAVERAKLIALITSEVHSRDVLERLQKHEVCSVSAFEWTSQLRFYWEDVAKRGPGGTVVEEPDCMVRQLNTSFYYGHEYLGNSGRLVITPLTDRCYMTLTMALNLHRGGSPQGPAGTGKTETVKDLGKSLGKLVIVVNCSDAMDFRSLGRMYSGLAQSGAWGCFDEFNRIDIEVLSVVALQISCILQAVSRNATSFVFEGTEIRLNTQVGIFITMNPGYAGRTELPDNLNSLFRPVAMMVPDSALIAEIMLFAEGFGNARALSKKVETLYRLSVQQLSKQDHYDFGLRAMTSCLRSSGFKRRNPTHAAATDDAVLCAALLDNNLPKFTEDDAPLFVGILGDLFPGTEQLTADTSVLETAVGQSLVASGYEPVPGLIQKAIQLYETKLTRHGVMLVGESGTGKSVVWKSLAKAMVQLSASGNPAFPAVTTHILNPKALTLAELYGEMNLQTNEWTDGVLSSIMRAICRDESPDQKWLILDGPVDTLWIESMNTVLDDNKILTLINGERIALNPRVSLLFEVADLSTASPATVSRAGMIYIDYQLLGYKPIIATWLKKQTDPHRAALLTSLCDKYIPLCVEFRKTCAELVPLNEAAVVRNFCSMTDAVLTLDNGVDLAKPSEEGSKLAEMWVLFALIWTFGATLTPDGRKDFDNWLRRLEGQFPSKDTVYEYVPKKEDATWQSWEDRLASQTWRYPTVPTPFFKLYVPTVEGVRMQFITRSLLEAGQRLLVVGDVGCGKTAMLANMAPTLEEKYKIMNLTLSTQTSAGYLQHAIEAHLEKKTKNIWTPVGGRPMVCMIDDLNIPVKDAFGSQPPLEFLRHLMQYGTTYHRSKQTLQHVDQLHLVAAMGPPGGSRAVLSQRVLSCFHVINMGLPSEASLNRIYGTILAGKLTDFDDLRSLAEPLTKATIEVYNGVLAGLLPTPAKPHYLFNLRDLSKIFAGICRATKKYFDTKEAILKLWAHETMRVFEDRLTDSVDRSYFTSLLDEKATGTFQTSLASLHNGKAPLLFTDFVSAPYNNGGNAGEPIYEEVAEMDRLRSVLISKLVEYNNEPGMVQLDIIIFQDAIEHICRIARVLRQPNGHMLLIGYGGSGRQSLTRLAAFLVSSTTYQIKISKVYRPQEWREDIKTVYRMAASEGRSVTFLLTDSQLVHESFLEDISHLLNNGEIPGLFTPDEVSEMKSQTPEPKIPWAPEGSKSFLAYLVNRARENLHLVLTMSPGNPAYRTRIRAFPALINAMNIDWFADWSEEALMEVAAANLGKTALSEKLQKNVATAFSRVHVSVQELSAQLRVKTGRSNFVTATSFLEFVSGYCDFLSSRKQFLEGSASKLQNGLKKLDDTRVSVEAMSVQLQESKRQVAVFQKQCEEFLVVIVQQKREADEQAKSVSLKAEKLAVEEEEVKGVAAIAQADLDQALPALQAATKALEAINKKDLNEIRSYGKPPPLVEKVMEAVMVLKKAEPTWDEAKRQLGNPAFIKQLIGFDKDNISDKILKRISQYCADENFQPDVVGRVSGASKSLCMWVRAMETYGIIFRQVAPKREKLRLAQESLDKKQKTLKEATDSLAAIQAKLEHIKQQYDEKLALKETLRKDAEEMEVKMLRAEQLVNGLASERTRWEKSIADYEVQLGTIPGDCLLSMAFLSYAGAFPSDFRTELLQKHAIQAIKALEIPCQGDVFSLVDFVSDPADVWSWKACGLPDDIFSIENGILIARSRRWPLIIDPQGQANKFVRAHLKNKNLRIVDPMQNDFLRILESAIQFGWPVLLQGVSETLDPILEPVLARSLTKKGGRWMIKLGEKEIDYSPDFKLIMTTRLANPVYSPEIFAQVTVINFTVKEQGLENQCLGLIVRSERADLEDQKSRLVQSMAAAKKTLLDLEDQILHLLSTAQGSLLDDVVLVNTLQSSKTTSQQVHDQLLVSAETEARIDAAREQYRPAAVRSSILYFCLNDLAAIDTTYQFSLDAYLQLFDRSLRKSTQSDTVQERIAHINDYHTLAVYRINGRSLFEHHKLLLSLHMATRVLVSLGKLEMSEYTALLTLGAGVPTAEASDGDAGDEVMANPCTPWLSDQAWNRIQDTERIPAMAGIMASFEQHSREWKSWLSQSEPESALMPGDWESKMSDVRRLIVIRALRPDRLVFAAQHFVSIGLGRAFLESPILDVRDVLADASSATPLIFLLSKGSDPMALLTATAQRLGMTDRLLSVSLGQGQSTKAERLVAEGMKHGHWIFLANCHLSMSWMSQLEKLVEEMGSAAPGTVHPDFRLWLSTNPHPQFPISILQRGQRMTTEPPQGLKANLSRLYSGQTDASIARTKQHRAYQRLLFSLTFFHAVVIERKKFLSLGWNVAAEFNDSDFETSQSLLEVLLNDYAEIPWDAMRYLIAEATYGGRVTDEWDRRTVKSYVNQYLRPTCLDDANVPLDDEGIYYIPQDVSSLVSVRHYIAQLPIADPPSIFGQHLNADINSQIREADRLVSTLTSLPSLKVAVSAASAGIGGGSGGPASGASAAQATMTLLQDLLQKVPPKIETKHLKQQSRTDPIVIVLSQEVALYNALLETMANTIEELQRGVMGLLLLSSALEDVLGAVMLGRVPQLWSQFYYSNKSLGDWLRDLAQRVAYFAAWAVGQDPSKIWLGAFMFPTGFLTAILQNAARANSIAVDSLSWETTVLSVDDEAALSGPPKDGIYLTNIYLEGASWDRKTNTLAEAVPLELMTTMPTIHLRPVESKRKSRQDLYTCPLYYYSIRAGSREKPSYILSLELKCGAHDPDFYIQHGTACLGSTDYI